MNQPEPIQSTLPVDLADVARRLRCWSLRMTTAAGSGHPSSCLSCADLVAALLFHEMRWDPGDPEAHDVDQFILSKGHAAPILWAALYEAGAISSDPLTLRRQDSNLEGHPTPANPWIKAATGSLGQGLSVACGIALGNRLDAVDARVYCLLGDGECAEGSVWEAAQFAVLHHLVNLVALVDCNGLGQSGPTPYGHDTSVLAGRFRAFGWHTLEIDGHDMDAIIMALAERSATCPTAIIARTLKGKGVSFLENTQGWHGKPVDGERLESALDEIGSVDPAVDVSVSPRRVGGYTPATGLDESIEVHYEPGQRVATRKAYGQALAKLGAVSDRVVALDGDVKNSTYAELFAQTYPERYFEGWIAEQNMVGVALGLATMGKLPFVSSFACFLTRAADFIRMAAHSRPPHLVLCGSHAGVSIGEDGPSQMGLEDLALFRSLASSSVLYPADAVSAERLTELAAHTAGLVYLRTSRPKLPLIYPNTETFTVGGSKVLRASAADACTVVSAGVTLHEALAAYEMLLQEGISVRVIDAYSVKPIDVATLRLAGCETGGILVVEDHWCDAGLGDAVARALAGTVPLRFLCVAGEPHSATPEELLRRHGIDRTAIAASLRELAHLRDSAIASG
jgi:transketolase